MKKLIILTVAATGVLSGAAAIAQDYHRDYRNDYRVAYYSRDRHDGLERQVNHLNRMLDHVRSQLRRYHGDWRVRRDVQQISREVDRVTHRYRSGDYNSGRLRHEVERLHARLHAIEQRLQVRSRDYYRWN